MRYVVVTRLYIEASSPDQAKTIAKVELAKMRYRQYPYTEGLEQFDTDAEEVLTEQEFTKRELR